MVLLGLLGLFLGAVMFSNTSAYPLGGAVVGAVLGLMMALILRLLRRSEELTIEIQRLSSDLKVRRAMPAATLPSVSTVEMPAHLEPSAAPAAPTPAPAADVVEPAIAAASVDVEPPQEQPALAHEAALSVEPPMPEPAPEPARSRPSDQPFDQPAPAGPDLFGRALVAIRAWLLSGNTVARVGILLLFLGLAFLLRYAGERVSVPIELRYAGVGLASVVLLVIGWHLRERNRMYGLILQGGAVAVMYLTIFAAMRLHPLIPPGPGGGLLVAVVVFSAILAVTQDSLVLAAAGAAGGFAAPVLASTGGEHHVALFSYLALLNAGIFAVAWFKAWRPLNLIGFVGTLGIGFAWGTRSFTPDMFGTTEPFLLLFVLMSPQKATNGGRERKDVRPQNPHATIRGSSDSLQ